MKDIARELGVSLMTVSKALRNHPDISEATRRRVQERAVRIGYQPNAIARSLATRRSFMVGLVLPDLMHSFFAEVVKGVASRLEPAGYQIVISDCEEDPVREQHQVKALLGRNVDGLIIATAQRTAGSEVFRMLQSRNARFVLIDRLPPGLDAHYVGCNDEEIGELATAHLVEEGCRRIAHLRGPKIRTGTGRLRGYQRALSAAGLEPTLSYVADAAAASDEAGYQAMLRLLALQPPPDGVFCYNDPVAAGAMRAAIDAGFKVPGDLAIVGAGNVHYSDLLRVPLSTVDQNSYGIGSSAAELLARCIDSKRALKPERIIMTPRLIVRQSSRRAADTGETGAASGTGSVTCRDEPAPELLVNSQ